MLVFPPITTLSKRLSLLITAKDLFGEAFTNKNHNRSRHLIFFEFDVQY
jgi:hypothetical protein